MFKNPSAIGKKPVTTAPKFPKKPNFGKGQTPPNFKPPTAKSKSECRTDIKDPFLMLGAMATNKLGLTDFNLENVQNATGFCKSAENQSEASKTLGRSNALGF